MLTKRIIACLDVTHGRVVKGVQFVDLVEQLLLRGPISPGDGCAHQTDGGGQEGKTAQTILHVLVHGETPIQGLQRGGGAASVAQRELAV